MRARALALSLVTAAGLATAPSASSAVAARQQSGPLAATGDDRSAVMLVVDTSDSMDEDDGTGKRIKIDGARQALIDFVRAIPTTTEVGLRVYPGSGADVDASGCSVGDRSVEIGADNLSTVDAKIRQLTASGSTPTGPALQRAAEDLRAKGFTTATIVLVSDGESNCGPDPCEVAAQIASTGIDVTVNTVGFRISDTGRGQLECIAEKTNGLYADADDNEQLTKQLDQFSRPLLEVALEHPSTAKAAVGGDEQGLVTVRATVASVGSSRVEDAQLTFGFIGEVKPTVLRSRQRLGGLDPGLSRTVQWQFRPPLTAQDVALAFTVTARGRNSAPTTATGSIAVLSGLSLDDAGPLLKDAKRIAVLGDSYSAGEGAGSYVRGTATLDNGCHRSRLTYAVPLWDAKASSGYRADVHACSGAVSSDLEHDNKANPVGPQVDELTRGAAYDAVLMTIGGNDIGFADIARSCLLLPVDCTRVHAGRVDAARGLKDTLQQDYRTVEGSLNTKANIAERGGRPGALIVVAYPTPFPLASRNACSAAYSLKEQRFFQDLVEALSVAAAAAVAALREEGLPVYFVPDTTDAFQPDHTYCSADPYIVRLRTLTNAQTAALKAAGIGQLSFDVGVKIRSRLVLATTSESERLALATAAQEQIHPNAAGYRAMTAQLIRWSTTAPARRPVVRTATFLPVTSNPSPDATVRIGPDGSSTATLQPGGVVQVQGSGLPPLTTAELQVRSEPVPLSRALVGRDGTVEFTVRIPSTIAPGAHSLVILAFPQDQAAVAELRADVEVRRQRPWWLLPLAGAGLLALLVGGWLWRRSAPEATGPPSPRHGAATS